MRYIFLVWLSTRAKILEWKKYPFPLRSYLVFVVSCFLGYLFEYPATIIQFRIITGALDSNKKPFLVFLLLLIFECTFSDRTLELHISHLQ